MDQGQQRQAQRVVEQRQRQALSKSGLKPAEVSQEAWLAAGLIEMGVEKGLASERAARICGDSR